MLTQRSVVFSSSVLFTLLFVGSPTGIADDNSRSRQVEFGGKIEMLPPQGTTGTWTVGGRKVLVNSSTQIHREGFSLQVGATVVVKGYQQRDRSIAAREITITEAAETGGGTPPPPAPSGGADYTLIGWNDLGMHCMDGFDYSVFTILPPANTLNCQLIGPDGRLVTNSDGITVTYEAVADPTGSINKSTYEKTNFWQYVEKLFGVALAPDMGLAGFAMPGKSNTPQAMKFEPALNWYIGQWIPTSPYPDDFVQTHQKNYYPMMKLTARDSGGNVLANSRVVTPVSDEMDCRTCHASGSVSTAMPKSGWVYNSDPEKDYKLNILALHDEKNAGNGAYQSALNQAGYNAAGLTATVQQDGTPVFCARCHGSNALPGVGFESALPLTQAIHQRHATAIDPVSNVPLGSSENRTACYRCHPGSSTRCLRGAMGNAVAPDGSMLMQCQSCHGTMSQVGATSRRGWFDEPNCQACHTGTATRNTGAIRFTSVFETSGQMRMPADTRFATNSDTPIDGASLYRYSTGHGGLQCSACHGSTHAIYPSSHENDNVQNIDLQGHAGMLSDCASCHKSQPRTLTGGPHGLHPIGQDWVSRHGDAAEGKTAQCQECHGNDYRGTVLSRALGPKTLSTEFGTINLWQGFQVGCYTCHSGPRSDDRNRNRAPVVQDMAVSGLTSQNLTVNLAASDADNNPLTLRIVNQPKNGTVGLSGSVATYFPFPGTSGPDEFTYAAWDGSTNSNLGSVKVTVQ